jgi:hypothetical protein
VSLGIGALQLMLDRGELKDWFYSSEIWIEATVSGLGFYLFTVHTVTTDERSFLNRDLLKSANFMAGTVLMFCGGLIMTGTNDAAADDAAKPDELSGADHRAGDRAARHREHGGDVPRRPADHPGRQPAAHPVRPSDDLGRKGKTRLSSSGGSPSSAEQLPGNVARRPSTFWAIVCCRGMERSSP